MKLWYIGKTGLIVLLTFTFTLYILSIYFDCRIYDILRLRRGLIGEQRSTNTTKMILLWNTMFGDENYMGRGDIFHGCPVDDCYATHERNYADPLDFDAILFHGNELELFDLPRTRGARQWYVFVNLESPANRMLPNHFYEDFFNLTMTYRLDSDLPWTYGVVKDSRTGRIVAPAKNVTWASFYNRAGGRRAARRPGSRRWIEAKSKAVVWFVSNCLARSGRQEYMRELSRHIPVDVYGDCGSKSCPRSEDCFAEVAEPDYFFYLSFENSLCDDYVTEKLYNALRYNIVPVVYGGANYTLFAPPRSHVNALDFDTPRELAEYLKKLMRDPRAYSEYFAWKEYYEIDGGVKQAACNLCRFLHEQKVPRTCDALSNWYSQSKCRLQELLRHDDYLTAGSLKRKD